MGSSEQTFREQKSGKPLRAPATISKGING
jgi:hypothetical protein